MELKAALFERYSFLRAGSLPGAADQLGWPFNQLGWIAITLRAPAGSRRLSQGGGEGGREGGGEGRSRVITLGAKTCDAMHSRRTSPW